MSGQSLSLTVGKKTKDQKAQQNIDEPEPDQSQERRGQWVTTAPTGERTGRKMDGTTLELPNALISYASDPESGQVRWCSLNCWVFPQLLRPLLKT